MINLFKSPGWPSDALYSTLCLLFLLSLLHSFVYGVNYLPHSLRADGLAASVGADRVRAAGKEEGVQKRQDIEM
jgi:hypothetical protein